MRFALKCRRLTIDLHEKLDGGRIKGGMFRAHIEWVVERHDLDALIGRVSPDTGKALTSGILANGWYPFRFVVETDRAIADVCSPDQPPDEIYRDLGRHSAEVNLNGVYRAFRKEDPHKFFERVAMHHRLFLDFGRAQYERIESTACRLSMLDYLCYSKVFCQSALGYYEAASRLQGGLLPVVCERECVCRGGSACVFEISWSSAT